MGYRYTDRMSFIHVVKRHVIWLLLWMGPHMQNSCHNIGSLFQEISYQKDM